MPNRCIIPASIEECGKDVPPIESPSRSVVTVIGIVTGAALSVFRTIEVELWLGILSSLRGFDIPVDSTILALVFSEQAAVIDFRGWRQIFGEEKRTFSMADYKRCLRGQTSGG